MAKQRKEQPDVKVNLGAFNKDERLALKVKWDEKEPEFDHQFKRSDVPQDELTRLDMEVVKDGDEVVGNRTSVLVRIPKASWQSQKEAESQASLTRVGSIYNDDGSGIAGDETTKWAKPRKPKRVP